MDNTPIWIAEKLHFLSLRSSPNDDVERWLVQRYPIYFWYMVNGTSIILLPILLIYR